MKDFKILLLVFVCSLTSMAWGIEVPQQVANAFKKVYPEITNVDWSTDKEYFVATFTKDQYETKLWFDSKGNWVMEQIDWGYLSEAPASIFNAFAASEYSSNEVQDVVAIQYPQKNNLIALLVAMPNEENGYMLFYNENGELIDADVVDNTNNCMSIYTLLQIGDD